MAWGKILTAYNNLLSLGLALDIVIDPVPFIPVITDCVACKTYYSTRRTTLRQLQDYRPICRWSQEVRRLIIRLVAADHLTPDMPTIPIVQHHQILHTYLAHTHLYCNSIFRKNKLLRADYVAAGHWARMEHEVDRKKQWVFPVV